ncbi:YebC/PmpR family DNA-binding transcriptional regulator [Candidatus Microgenomates bacterium]|nr:YebC/PmpR family DNA-binding transcriptional regulator [Candidatus Microgenomates bacterium]
MSGHSHYDTIKRQKEGKDAKRGNLFSKLSKMITIAIKTGGSSNPETNFKLRVAIDQAKSFNMPKENIERILKSAEDKLANVEEITYEGYGPQSVSVIVETATDNKNRTAQEVKGMFEKAGGSMGGPGSVSFNFESKGYMLLKKTDDVETQTLELIDLGVEDLEEVDDGLEVFVPSNLLRDVREKIQTAGFEILKMELKMVPKNYIEIENEDKKQKVINFLETLEEHDDVQRVFSNF